MADAREMAHAREAMGGRERQNHTLTRALSRPHSRERFRQDEVAARREAGLIEVASVLAMSAAEHPRAILGLALLGVGSV